MIIKILRKKSLLLFLPLVLAGVFDVVGQSRKESGGKTAILDLVGALVSEEDSVPDYYPSELADIVSDYYIDAVVPESVTEGVLAYLADVYSEHGYHETGDWAPKTGRRLSYGRRLRYVPYEGELPDYEMSDFQTPTEGRLTSGYGYRKKFHRFHYGVDIALTAGDTVRCALPGVVTKIGYDPRGYGKYIVVSHSGGMETLYGHLQKGIADMGAMLKAGDPIGLGGTTGNATGAHLHFETRYYGRPVNPSNYISSFSLTSQ
ncbi:MAG: M23 family metallopeptidase [Muribaculaceae bacterium]|nr:M23 family metallopeptidase [Muribaculaceae bacterium]